jgi:hypothetical protein
LVNWQMDKVWTAAANDPAVAEAMVRVQQLVDPPARLLRPSFLMRLVTSNRRPRMATPADDSCSGSYRAFDQT